MTSDIKLTYIDDKLDPLLDEYLFTLSEKEHIFEYDYLPQSTEDTNWNNQESPERNELFRVMISYLADEKGTLQLPEHDKSLSKLFKLAQLSQTTQDVFSNKWAEKAILTKLLLAMVLSQDSKNLCFRCEIF